MELAYGRCTRREQVKLYYAPAQAMPSHYGKSPERIANTHDEALRTVCFWHSPATLCRSPIGTG